MGIIFLDFESTGINQNLDDIITGYFIVQNNGKITDELEVKLRPSRWSEEAAKVHGISWGEAMSYDDPREKLPEIYDFINDYGYPLACHANYNSVYGKGYFDIKLIEMNLFFYNQDLWWKFRAQDHNKNAISTHTLAKQNLKLKNYKLNTVAEYFDYRFNHHNSKEDTKACRFIYNKIITNKFTQKLDFNI